MTTLTPSSESRASAASAEPVGGARPVFLFLLGAAAGSAVLTLARLPAIARAIRAARDTRSAP